MTTGMHDCGSLTNSPGERTFIPGELSSGRNNRNSNIGEKSCIKEGYWLEVIVP